MKQALPWGIAILVFLVFGYFLNKAGHENEDYQQQNTSLLRQRDSVVEVSRWERLSADTARAYSRSLNLRLDTLLSRASKEDVRIIKDYSDIRAAVARGDTSFLLRTILWQQPH